MYHMHLHPDHITKLQYLYFLYLTRGALETSQNTIMAILEETTNQEDIYGITGNNLSQKDCLVYNKSRRQLREKQ